MKILLPLFVLIAICSADTMVETPSSYKEYKKGERYFHFPGEDGKLYLVDSQQPIQYYGIHFGIHFGKKHPSNKYYLYTRKNPTTPQVIVHEDENSIKQSHFNKNTVSIFLAHGWKGDGHVEMNMMLKNAFLEDGDVNVVVLDWGCLAKNTYVNAMFGAVKSGEALGQFINWLTTIGVHYENVHLVGFSLGGHLVGNAGKETCGKVARITALDPAGPLWFEFSSHINKSDAQYVEVIHTNTAALGYSYPCGHADFYLNGGATMPGCGYNASCSHSWAYKIMAATVMHKQLDAHQCCSLKDVDQDHCTGDVYPLGTSDLTKSREGIFRVNTNQIPT